MGSSGNGAAQGTINANAMNQMNTNRLIDNINSTYADPNLAASNQNYVNAVQNAYKTQAQQQQQVAGRNLNFALARSGLTGGSAASDENTQLTKNYVAALANGSNAAQQAGSQIASSQNAQKQALLGLAGSSGMTGTIGSALASANSGMLGNAGAYAGANTLGNAFQSTAQWYNQEQNAAAQRQAQGSPWGSFYGYNG